jgi:DNA-binding transcriptional regulator YdaS (Cro superfamily)
MSKIRAELRRAVHAAGSQHKLAQMIGFSQPWICVSIQRGTCSPRMAAAIHRATGGSVRQHILCPSVFDPPAKAA